MTSMAFLRAGILSARREGRTYPLRRHEEPEDMSILSSILGVTQEVWLSFYFQRMLNGTTDCEQPSTITRGL